MECRPAIKNDLTEINSMYKDIVKNMIKNGFTNWDDIYPFCMFEEDIRNKNLYVIVHNNEVVACFALLDTVMGQDEIIWEDLNTKAMYLSRLGVNTKYLKQGIGALAVDHAKRITKEKGCDYLRLFVVDFNKPALNLYLKSGFKQATGEYSKESTSDDNYLLEYAYEIKV